MNQRGRDELLTQLVARMKREIDADIAAGTVPASVRSYSDLHGYVDANGYGGLCDDGALEALEVAFGGTRQIGQMLDASPPDLLTLINEAQDRVDEWLRRGRSPPTE